MNLLVLHGVLEAAVHVGEAVQSALDQGLAGLRVHDRQLLGQALQQLQVLVVFSHLCRSILQGGGGGVSINHFSI